MKRIAILLGALAVLLGGVAYASIPGPDGTIHGCRNDSNGNLRVIDSEAACPSGWSALNWPSQDRYAHWTDGNVTRQAQMDAIPAGGIRAVSVECPDGKVAIHGGFQLVVSSLEPPAEQPDIRVLRFFSTGGVGTLPTGWSLSVRNMEEYAVGPGRAVVLVRCVNPDLFPR